MVIPAMDRIDQDFATRSLSSDYHPAIRIALSLGKATLNKYYDKTDHSETYRIAMSASFVSLNLPPKLMAAASSTSKAQARLLPEGRVGGCLDSKC
jgi:hypothetical protein